MGWEEVQGAVRSVRVPRTRVVTTGCRPCSTPGAGGAPWESAETMQACRDGGRGDAGTHFNTENHFNQSIGCFVTPFPSCPKPSSDSYLCLVAEVQPTLPLLLPGYVPVAGEWRTTPAARGAGTEPGEPHAPAGMGSILRNPLEVGDPGPWRREIDSGLPRV